MNKKNLTIIAAALTALILLRSLTRKKGFKNKIAELAKQEFKKWGSGTIKEGNTKTIQSLRDYWQQGTKLNKSDNYYINTAWSAAFISYIMRKAGAGDKFKYSTAHSDYINAAKQNRKNNIKTFQAFRKNEMPVTVGDLICYPRTDGVTFDTNGGYYAHCDIVTEIRPGSAITIGGNVSNTVNQTTYTLDSNNKVTTSKVHAIIKTLL